MLLRHGLLGTRGTDALGVAAGFIFDGAGLPDDARALSTFAAAAPRYSEDFQVRTARPCGRLHLGHQAIASRAAIDLRFGLRIIGPDQDAAFEHLRASRAANSTTRPGNLLAGDAGRLQMQPLALNHQSSGSRLCPPVDRGYAAGYHNDGETAAAPSWRNYRIVMQSVCPRGRGQSLLRRAHCPRVDTVVDRDLLPETGASGTSTHHRPAGSVVSVPVNPLADMFSRPLLSVGRSVYHSVSFGSTRCIITRFCSAWCRSISGSVGPDQRSLCTWAIAASMIALFSACDSALKPATISSLTAINFAFC